MQSLISISIMHEVVVHMVHTHHDAHHGMVHCAVPGAHAQTAQIMQHGTANKQAAIIAGSL
jgi:hypothetical protein